MKVVSPTVEYEPEVGELVLVDGNTYKTVESGIPNCAGCALRFCESCDVKCLDWQRDDHKNVYFSSFDELAALLSSQLVELE